MAVVKNAQIRYRLIDQKIRNVYKPYPSKEFLRQACEESLYGSETGENISISTIEKDLKYMRDEFDAPIKYSKQEEGYYYEDPNFSLEKIPLQEDELTALRFASASLLPYKEMEIFKKFELAISKIFEELTVGSKQEEESHIWFDRKREGPKGQEHLNAILNAIKEGLFLKLSYFSWSSNQEKNYHLKPLMLREYNQLWYVIAESISHQEIRTFELGRITDLQVEVNEAHTSNIAFNAESYFNHAFGITVPGNYQPEHVTLLASGFTAKYLHENKIHKTQKDTWQGKDLKITLHIFITPELKSEILGWGGNIKVLQPQILQDWHREEIHKMQKKYAAK